MFDACLKKGNYMYEKIQGLDGAFLGLKNIIKYKELSRDGSANKYTNKICRDNLSYPLYIPTLAFLGNTHAPFD